MLSTAMMGNKPQSGGKWDGVLTGSLTKGPKMKKKAPAKVQAVGPNGDTGKGAKSWPIGPPKPKMRKEQMELD